MGKSITEEDVSNVLQSLDGNSVKFPTTFFYEKTILKKYEYRKMCDVVLPYVPSAPLLNATIIRAQWPIVSEGDKYAVRYNRGVIASNNTSYLTSLITLRLNLSPQLFEQFGNIETLISVDEKNVYDFKNSIFKKVVHAENGGIEPIEILDKDLDMIKTWCEEYGYPFSVRYGSFTADITKKSTDKSGNVKYYLRHQLKKPNYYESFWVWDFLRRLQILYAAFLFYYKIDGKDMGDLNLLNLTDRTFFNYEITDCKRLLKRIYRTINLRGILDFEQYEKGKKDMLMGYATSNAFDLAIYSLFLYMAMSGKALTRCKNCKKLFVPANRKQEYCLTRPCDVNRNRKNCAECNLSVEEYEACKYRICYGALYDKREKAKKRQAEKQLTSLK